MTAIQHRIMKTVDLFARTFKDVKTAGDDAIVFSNGTIRLTIRFITQIDFFQVIVADKLRVLKNAIGVREHELSSYFITN